MSNIIDIEALGFPWPAIDPFLFCVYHDDAYPAGNEHMGPAASLVGRDLGQDFAGKDGWRMYHGRTVPGFPAHPHRGFETVTIVRRGLIDHSDSLGATARFGGGDVQWLTAGRGIVHSEMFPLLSREGGNPLELFQIWLNLPARDKMVEPHFTMFWSEEVPSAIFVDPQGASTELVCIAGRLAQLTPLAPPPNSWATREESDLAIWTLKMSPGARWQLPAAQGTNTRRNLYLFKGQSVSIDGVAVPGPARVELRADHEVALHNGSQVAELLVLQGRPLAEPVVQHGPFVMNSREEVRQAFADYQRTQFGGWPFANEAPVHPRERSRFARHADGRVQERR
jgi:quercetin 2,3-dioxygenase